MLGSGHQHVTGLPRRLFVFLATLLLGGLYFSFLAADILTGDPFHPFSRIAKYLSILLCFGLTLAISPESGHDRRDIWTLRLAFFLTIIADFAIGILGYFVAGIAVFFLVQLVYIVRHSQGFVWNRREVISGLLTLGCVAGLFFHLYPGLVNAGLFWPVLLYALVLAASLWLAIGTVWRDFFPPRISFFIAGGMLLFFLCDLNVGLGAVLPDGELRSVVRILVWFFYLPAQLLLALSGFRVTYRN